MENRVIKFRAWDKRNKEMVEVNLIFEYRLKDGWHKSLGEYSNKAIHPDWFELMQYTGLKDKNGMEIYEGDIVLGKFILDDVEDYIYLSLTDIERKNQSKTFLIEDISYLYTNPIPEDIEVIGNIYQNKDLLKK